MRPLAALERFLERLFERPSARFFGARLEPVTLVRRLERVMDEERRAGADGMLAPTRFTVEVSPADAAALARIGTLEDDLRPPPWTTPGGAATASRSDRPWRCWGSRRSIAATYGSPRPSRTDGCP